LLLINTFPVSDAVENELLIEKNENDRLLFSTSNGSEIASIQLFDILGRLIYDSSPKPQEEAIYIVDVNFKTTLFIAKVTLADGKVLTKKALN